MKPEEGPNQESKELGVSRGISIIDLVLRIVAIVGTLGGALAMGTTDETLPFSTQAVIFRAQYDDIPTFRFVILTSHVHVMQSNESFHYINCSFWRNLVIFFHQRFFVIANATVCGYLAISLPMAIYHIIRTRAAKSRALLIFLDTVINLLLSVSLIQRLRNQKGKENSLLQYFLCFPWGFKKVKNHCW